MADATRVADRARGPFIGSYAGTTATQNINIGFKPAFIIAYNKTDGDTMFFWHKSDTSNVVIGTTAFATNASAIAQVDDGTVLGFSLPASDNVVNENGKTYYFIAWPE